MDFKKDKGLIFDIERFSFYDGPGIRTVIFFKGCSLNCDWCQNPEGKLYKKEIFFNKDLCIRCSNCQKFCPVKKIEIKKEVIISKTNCINNCEICADKCPTNAISEAGIYYSPDELLNIILKDRIFFKLSKGGVTFSGGDPLMQVNFLKKILYKLKEKNMNTIVETSGYANWESFKKINYLVDKFYYDLKIMDSELHKKFIGFSNELILQNLISLFKLRGKSGIVIRIPLIPAVNDDLKNLELVADFLKDKLSDSIAVELLPFNELSKAKYKNFNVYNSNNLYFPYMESKTQSKEKLGEIKEFFKKRLNNIKILTVN